MATLLEDIKIQSAWIVTAFGADKLNLDYTVESFRLIDNFFDEHSENGIAKPNGRLSQNCGPILFSIGSYVGETIIRNVPDAVWITDDNDPQGEVNVEIKLADGTIIGPMHRVIKRFKNGPEDGIYAYGAVVIREIGPGGYWDKMKKDQLTQGLDKKDNHKKPWWKLW